jgi:hypothetical protein
MATAPTRLYLIRRTDAEGDPPRLVRAVNAAAALRHVVAKTLSVDLPTQDELVAAVQAGVVPEVSGQAATDEGKEAAAAA